MNPWTALLIGILLGWLIEYAIDWLFWRRKTTKEKDVEELKTQLQATQDKVGDLEAQLAAAQTDYSDLEVETASRVAEVEEKAEATVEASKPKYESDEFKGSLKGTLAGLGIGAAVGTAVASGDETEIAEEEDLSGVDVAGAAQPDGNIVATDGDPSDDESQIEEIEALDEESLVIDDGPAEEIELDDTEQQEEEPSIADVDQDTRVTEAVEETVEADSAGETPDIDTDEPPAVESDASSEGGQAS